MKALKQLLLFSQFAPKKQTYSELNIHQKINFKFNHRGLFVYGLWECNTRSISERFAKWSYIENDSILMQKINAGSKVRIQNFRKKQILF